MRLYFFLLATSFVKMRLYSLSDPFTRQTSLSLIPCYSALMLFTGIDIHYQSVCIVDSVSLSSLSLSLSLSSLLYVYFYSFSFSHMILLPPTLLCVCITKQKSAGASAVSWEDWWTYEGISGEPINLIDLLLFHNYGNILPRASFVHRIQNPQNSFDRKLCVNLL